ncbi:DUF6702 family protein [Chitinophaga sp. GCM10012297]|uniref:Uncharacterized protein n=1 Tax=Chitinophaga chungangae TaxID=2821488 RepID=A0ABS3Y8Q8_9BACT|nr:DUF6702 family protein [Chitinophaga chungangae]MBO9151072.1 hypothetical protein [Chitinophaga chungangae]
MGVLLCKWLLPVWFGAVHPFYMSVTEIRYNQPRKSLEVSCRIFTDDLENALKKYNKTSLDIIKPKDRPSVDTMIARYLRQHLALSADGKKLPLQYLGYQISEDAVWCFLEHAPMAPFKHLDIQNDVLYAEHDTQGHMIHLIVNDQRKSTKIDNPKAAASFDL